MRLSLRLLLTLGLPFLCALALGTAVVFAGCQETFVDPTHPDLYKPPADFGLGGGHPDLGGQESDQGVPDLSNKGPDLAKSDKDAA